MFDHARGEVQYPDGDLEWLSMNALGGVNGK